jgi:hypothetical protein
MAEEEANAPPTIAAQVWQKLGFCDCGRPEDVLALFRNSLRAMADRRAAEQKCPAPPKGNACCEMAAHIETDVLPLGSVHALLVRYTMEAADLTEHGGSVYGAWPTERGMEFLAFLETTPEEDWMGDED